MKKTIKGIIVLFIAIIGVNTFTSCTAKSVIVEFEKNQKAKFQNIPKTTGSLMFKATGEYRGSNVTYSIVLEDENKEEVSFPLDNYDEVTENYIVFTGIKPGKYRLYSLNYDGVNLASIEFNVEKQKQYIDLAAGDIVYIGDIEAKITSKVEDLTMKTVVEKLNITNNSNAFNQVATAQWKFFESPRWRYPNGVDDDKKWVDFPIEQTTIDGLNKKPSNISLAVTN